MSFVVDTDICSAYLKGDPRVFNRFIQHSGGLAVTAALGKTPTGWPILAGFRDEAALRTTSRCRAEVIAALLAQAGRAVLA